MNISKEDISRIRNELIKFTINLYNLELEEEDFNLEKVKEFVNCSFNLKSDMFVLNFPPVCEDSQAEIRYQLTDNFVNDFFNSSKEDYKPFVHLLFDWNESFYREVTRINRKSVNDIFYEFSSFYDDFKAF
jgi:hypothetical protein